MPTVQVAAILSVVESRKRLGVAARSYLAKLPPGLAKNHF